MDFIYFFFFIVGKTPGYTFWELILGLLKAYSDLS